MKMKFPEVTVFDRIGEELASRRKSLKMQGVPL
jgi:hypothetical protein